MRVFLAGAYGAIGRRLIPLLVKAGHEVTGTTRSPESAEKLAKAGVHPAVLDVFDAPALAAAVRSAAPQVMIHQLTDLPREFDQARVSAAYPANARIRIEGTRNLIAAAQRARVARFIVQSIAFAYAAHTQRAGEPHQETDPLNSNDPMRAVTVRGALDMEIVLRYGLLYGPGTWHMTAIRKPALHVDAAAHAALLAMTRGARGIYNIADEEGLVSIAKARAQLGFAPQFRLECDIFS